MSEDHKTASFYEQKIESQSLELINESCRQTCYKSFANSVTNRSQFIHEIDYFINKESESDSEYIDQEDFEEEVSRSSVKSFEKLDSPKGFQNPMILSATNTSVELKGSERQEFQNHNRSALNSLKTVISLYVTSSCQTSDSNYDLPRGSSENLMKCNIPRSEIFQSDPCDCTSSDHENTYFSSDENKKSNIIEKRMTKLCALGQGNEARVFLCELDGCENLVAYKEFNQQKVTFSKVQNEFNHVESLEHPNILKYYYLKTKNSSRDSYGIVMEFMEGGTLLEYINLNSQNIKYEEKMNLAQQIIDGVLYLHSKNIIHGDLKPDNIFLSNDKTKLKIGDFGVAEKVSCNSEILNKQSGSLLYMAPEILFNQQFSKKADIWSLGCVLYFLFFGYHPFQKVTRISELQKLMRDTNPIKFEEKGQFYEAEIRSLIENCLICIPEERNILTKFSYNSIS